MQLNDIQHIAVIGLGRMGHGIAQAFAMAGYSVAGFDENAAARENVHERIRSNLADFASNDLIRADAIDNILGRIHVADSENGAADGADFVVEAIAEQLAVKQAFFGRIESAVSERTIIASNSSTFTVSASSVPMQRPDRAIVTHWFNPPHIVPTVEVVPGPHTAEHVTETTLALHRRIGKLAVRVNAEIPGFLVNRVQIAMVREIWDLYERGVASAEDIDAAIRGSVGFRLAAVGPLAICDFGGVDIWSTVYQELAPDLRSDSTLPDAVKALVESGRCGTRTASGFHDYDPETIDQLTSERDAKLLQLARLLHQRDK